MSINVDPESLKFLAEDVDLAILRATSALRKENESLKKESESLKKQIADLRSVAPEKTAEIVSHGSISAIGEYSTVSVVKSHSLGVTPSSTMLSFGIHDSASYSAYAYVSAVTSTTVTISVPAGYAVGNVFVLLLK